MLVKNEEYWLPYCLESVAGWFSKMVIYDVGSTDATQDIIKWYQKKEAHRTDFRVRLLPHCEPIVQGTFRNALIAETQADWYLILDGDELYRESDLIKIEHLQHLLDYEITKGKIYGVFNRIEVLGNLERKYNIERTHHRVYHRTAIWDGTHPGESPAIPQKSHREFNIPEVKVFHMHNAARSSKDHEVPGRSKRKIQKTYHPGEPVKLDILDEYPILREPVEDFPIDPTLRRLQCLKAATRENQ